MKKIPIFILALSLHITSCGKKEVSDEEANDNRTSAKNNNTSDKVQPSEVKNRATSKTSTGQYNHNSGEIDKLNFYNKGQIFSFSYDEKSKYLSASDKMFFEWHQKFTSKLKKINALTDGYEGVIKLKNKKKDDAMAEFTTSIRNKQKEDLKEIIKEQTIVMMSLTNKASDLEIQGNDITEDLQKIEKFNEKIEQNSAKLKNYDKIFDQKRSDSIKKITSAGNFLEADSDLSNILAQNQEDLISYTEASRKLYDTNKKVIDTIPIEIRLIAQVENTNQCILALYNRSPKTISVTSLLIYLKDADSITNLFVLNNGFNLSPDFRGPNYPLIDGHSVIYVIASGSSRLKPPSITDRSGSYQAYTDFDILSLIISLKKNIIPKKEPNTIRWRAAINGKLVTSETGNPLLTDNVKYQEYLLDEWKLNNKMVSESVYELNKKGSNLTAPLEQNKALFEKYQNAYSQLETYKETLAEERNNSEVAFVKELIEKRTLGDQQSSQPSRYDSLKTHSVLFKYNDKYYQKLNDSGIRNLRGESHMNQRKLTLDLGVSVGKKLNENQSLITTNKINMQTLASTSSETESQTLSLDSVILDYTLNPVFCIRNLSPKDLTNLNFIIYEVDEFGNILTEFQPSTFVRHRTWASGETIYYSTRILNKFSHFKPVTIHATNKNIALCTIRRPFVFHKSKSKFILYCSSNK